MTSFIANGIPGPALKWCAALALAACITLAVHTVIDEPECLPRRLWSRYVASLERKMRNMFVETRGAPIAVAQLVMVVLVAIGRLLVAFPYAYLAVAVVMAAPGLYLERMRVVRMRKLETQVQPFILALASALRTTPSVGQAIATVHPLLARPLHDEIGLVLKEVRVGSSLEQSLLHMGGRVRVTDLEAALSSILIGRQVGGNLPDILDTTASTLREMARLAGVVRSKTASGRTQLIVLALAPVVVLLGFERASPGYFIPLSETFAGLVVAAVAGVLWVSALITARQVLAIEL